MDNNDRRPSAESRANSARHTPDVGINHAVEHLVRHGVLITDPNLPDNPITYCNSAFERLTGYEKQEILGRNCRFLQGPGTDTEAVAAMRRAIAEERECTVTLLNYRKGGAEFWNELTISPVFDESGRLSCFVGVQNDVTSRRRTENQLTRLGAVVEASRNEIYTFDQTSLRFLHANQGACDNLGYSLGELKTLTPLDIKPKFTREAFEAFIEPLQTGDKSTVEFTTVHRRKDGSFYPVEGHLQRSQYDSTPVFVAIILDITERERLEEHKRLIQSTAEGIYGVDLDGNCTFCNAAMLKLLGYENEHDLIGKNIHRLVHHTRPDGTPYPVDECHIYQAFRTNEQHHVDDEVFWCADGTSVPVEYWSYPVVEDGRVTGCVVSVVDITERRAAVELLRRSKALAEEATVMKSRFLAAASHDLRQPLQSLGIYLSVLKQKLEDRDARDVSDKMRKSLDTMGELLDALLDISKLDSGSITAEKRDFRIQDLLERIVSDNRPSAEEKGLELVRKGDACVVHSDPALLERVIENFVTNAVRYTEQGTVTLHCRCGENSARIEVSDTGIGIPDEEVGKVFEEYYQLDNPVRDRRKGLGLGLSIVKHIARLLDHTLDVVSVPGQGSTFSVNVPLGKPMEEPDEVSRRVTATTVGSHTPVVLFVDDDPAIVDATTMLLETTGAIVHTALCGDEGLAHIDRGVRPDIIVSDYRLPGYTGVEFIRRVREATVNDLPTVLLTGDTAAKEIESASLANCIVMHKPVDTERLIAVIGQCTG